MARRRSSGRAASARRSRPSRRPFIPPSNDNISRGFDAVGIIPERLRGSDLFLDIVTWNIRFFHHHDADRVKRVTDILAVLNADIIVLQEILNASLAPVADGLRANGAGHYEVAYGTTGGNQRVAMLWDLDWVRSKDDVRELFGRGQVMTADGKDAFPRLPLWSAFTLRQQRVDADPFDFQLVGVHLKSQRGGGDTQRRLAGEWLASWLDSTAPHYDADVVVLGDWNEPPDSTNWQALHALEDQGRALFRSINNQTAISHFYYKNRSDLGSRLDLAALSIAASDEVAGDPEVVRWAHLDTFLETQPRASEIKEFLKELSQDVSDHMPVITRFYLEEQSS
jgi:endonuclease/exonuclease/phosphatase family metal-dependent hydrolase